MVPLPSPAETAARPPPWMVIVPGRLVLAMLRGMRDEDLEAMGRLARRSCESHHDPGMFIFNENVPNKIISHWPRESRWAGGATGPGHITANHVFPPLPWLGAPSARREIGQTRTYFLTVTAAASAVNTRDSCHSYKLSTPKKHEIPQQKLKIITQSLKIQDMA